MDKHFIAAAKIALIYAVFAGCWILFSDFVVEATLEDPTLRALAQTYKGLAFVVITTVLLLFLVTIDNRAIEKANDLDPLTGLPNLNLFIRLLNSRIKNSKPGEQIIFGYLDIDNFKAINETHGYAKADEFLLDISQRLSQHGLTGSVFSRLHADQFASFGPVDEYIDMDEHIRHFQRIFLARAKHFGIEATCSLGIAIYPADGTDAASLMVSATEALKAAKASTNAIQYHDKALTQRAIERRQLIMDLRKAIKNRELTVVYQPKYSIATREVSGVEVLVRWTHPEKGFISPAVFIPLAEESHMSADITRLVVSKTAQELGATGLLGKAIKHVAINVSATEFNDSQEMNDLTSFILEQEALAPFVRIEITETATLNDMRNSMAIIARLQQSGLTFSVDDFGTGYTSLAMLKDLTVDEIKIDRSFVAGIEEDERAKTIVEAIIGMAHSFDINVVAEGVEKEQQLVALAELGCIEAQGYFLGRPVPVKELVEHVTKAPL